MNQSNVSEHINNDLVFKGLFYELTPISIPLCILIIVQNTVIILYYYKDRAKLVEGLFMGIALADILNAQGQIVLSVISILVYTGVVDKSVIYKSLYYYMLTALPGVNLSKLLNLAMTITLTVKAVNPFGRVNTSRVKKILATIAGVIVSLHICDTITGAVYLAADHVSPHHLKDQYRYLMELFFTPGVPSIAALSCIHSHSAMLRCEHSNHAFKKINCLYGLSALYYISIPLTVLICMIIQVKYLRRSLQNTSPDTADHVVVTVQWIALLFFVCNAAFSLGIICWYIFHLAFGDGSNHRDQFYVDYGVLLGITEFLLPLIYAVLYPIILICRKQELRLRYGALWRRILGYCGLRTSNSEEAEEEQERGEEEENEEGGKEEEGVKDEEAEEEVEEEAEEEAKKK